MKPLKLTLHASPLGFNIDLNLDLNLLLQKIGITPEADHPLGNWRTVQGVFIRG